MRAWSLPLQTLGHTHPAGAWAACPSCRTVPRACPLPAGPLRARGAVAILLMRACRWCRQPFFLCPACDRGHAYCSLPCRRAGRTQTLRAAGQRHQQSPEGRLDHRDRQRAYRARCRARVTHHASPAPPACGILPPAPLLPTSLVGASSGPGGQDAQLWSSSIHVEIAAAPAPRCRVCGCRGRCVRVGGPRRRPDQPPSFRRGPGHRAPGDTR